MRAAMEARHTRYGLMRTVLSIPVLVMVVVIAVLENSWTDRIWFAVSMVSLYFLFGIAISNRPSDPS